jgi:hypothetical protein
MAPSTLPTTDKNFGPPAFCPSCGAGIEPQRTHCWLCHAPLDALPVVDAVVVDEKLAAAHPAQFTIATILLITTLAAVLLGVFRLNAPLGVVLAIFSVPALVRTASVARREKRHGQRVSTAGKIGHFFLSFLIMYAVWTAASMAFTIAAMGTCLAAVATSNVSENVAMGVGIVGLLLSLVVGLAAAGTVLWATWPKKD